MTKIDLHVHTKERSSCGRSSEEEQIRAAIGAGLDAIVFTDHDRLISRSHLQELNDTYTPFKIFGGIEVSVWDQRLLSYEHLLVLGIHDVALEHLHWTYPELHQFVKENQGFLAVAHLFRFASETNLDLERFPPDAIEAHSNNIRQHLAERLESFAEEQGFPVLSNSDAHHINMIGGYYNLLAQTPADERELIEILRAEEFKCVYPG
jgi:histidinol phosphatase-like PHP family hydrolase